MALLEKKHVGYLLIGGGCFTLVDKHVRVTSQEGLHSRDPYNPLDYTTHKEVFHVTVE